MIDYRKELNKEQLEAVQTINGPLLLPALGQVKPRLWYIGLLI